MLKTEDFTSVQAAVRGIADYQNLLKWLPF